MEFVIKIRNTLSGRKEIFKPLKPPEVGIYVCGPTPYDETHIGHARTYVFFDVVARFLSYLGYRPKVVVNLTDIDDKIIRKGRSFESWQKVADVYSRRFLEVLRALKIKPPAVMPRVTAHIQEIITFVQKLIDRGYAYVAKDGIYFEVRKFKDYGKLSGIDLSSEKVARIEPSPWKKNPEDFAVWKFKKPEEPFWHAPFGDGRPGWHIECSVMATKYLGKSFDIHGGGEDLIFPHHENEIAQSEAALGVKPWVKYWMHVAFLRIKGEKMSKSLGNIIAVKEVLEKAPPEALRFYLLSAHYRKPLDFSWEGLTQAIERWKNIVRAYFRAYEAVKFGRYGTKDAKEELRRLFRAFVAAMADDFNTPEAFAALDRIASAVSSRELLDRSSFSLALEIFEKVEEILGILPKPDARQVELIEQLLELRESLRKEKKYEEADRIRKKLKDLGVEVEDTPAGPFFFFF